MYNLDKGSVSSVLGIRMRKLFLFPLFGLVIALTVPVNADTVIEEIIARVNNQVVTRTEYQHSRDQLKQEVQQQDSANADKLYTERERDVLRDLIDQQLLLDKGKDLGITADTEVIKRLDEMRKQMNLESMEDLEKAAQAQGVSFEDFKQNLRNQIITQQVIGKEVGQRMAITKEEEQEFYEKHKAEMTQPEQIRLSEILVTTQKPGDKDAPSEENVKAAETKARDLLAQIQSGAKFEEVAKKSSDGPSAAQGGDLGYFKRGMLAKELEDKTFTMQENQPSDVIRTKQGFVILEVTEHQAEGVPTLKDVEGKVQDAIYMQKLQPALRAYLTKLREEAYIDVKPGYVDSGASPNQTKPVETASKEAAAKNLKKKKKLGVF
jgi:peptidyl-prolyl cis-trans isomerase SurA